jgi:nucleoid-associated protein YgaU
MEGGNQGYLYGKPQSEDRQEYRKTRKIYVLEFSKPADVEDISLDPIPQPAPPSSSGRESPSSAPPPSASEPQPERPRPVTLPPIDSVEPAASHESMDYGFEEYTIEKNDTLQKISKKFYNTYRKWGQIYEANKDVIPDPDKITPGIVIRIPRESLVENLK